MITFVFLIGLYLPAYASTLEENLNAVSEHMNIVIFVEDSIRGNTVSPLPGNTASMDHMEIIRIAVRGYSHAMMYDENGMEKLWVYSSSSGNFTKISPTPRVKTESAVERKPKFSQSRIAVKPVTKDTPLARPVNFTGYDDRGVKATFSGASYRETAFGFREPASGISFANDFNSKSNPVRRPGAGFGESPNPRKIAKELNEEKGLEFSAQMQGAQRRLIKK